MESHWSSGVCNHVNSPDPSNCGRHNQSRRVGLRNDAAGRGHERLAPGTQHTPRCDGEGSVNGCEYKSPEGIYYTTLGKYVFSKEIRKEGNEFSGRLPLGLSGSETSNEIASLLKRKFDVDTEVGKVARGSSVSGSTYLTSVDLMNSRSLSFKAYFVFDGTDRLLTIGAVLQSLPM